MRLEWTLSEIAATVAPDASFTGTAMDRSPISYSSSLIAKPLVRALDLLHQLARPALRLVG
jgi:hypothetical protein